MVGSPVHLSRVAPESPSGQGSPSGRRLPPLHTGSPLPIHRWFSSAVEASPPLLLDRRSPSPPRSPGDMSKLPVYFSGTGRGHLSIDLAAIQAACTAKQQDLHVAFALGDRWEIVGQLVDSIPRPDGRPAQLNARFSLEDLSQPAETGTVGPLGGPGVVVAESNPLSAERMRRLQDLEALCMADDAAQQHEREAEKRNELVRRRWMMVLALLAVVAWYAFGIAYYMNREDWSFVEAFYFCTVTITTVGYGDFSPTSTETKLVTCGYILLGLLLVGTGLGMWSDLVLEGLLMADDDDPTDDCIQLPCARGCQLECRTVLLVLVLLVVCCGSGIAFFMNVDPPAWSFTDAFYYTIVTISTVGYGDFYPTTNGGKWFAIFWTLFSVLALAKAISLCLDMSSQWKLKHIRARQLKRHVTLRDLRAYGNADGKLDKSEFALCKLKAMGVISARDIEMCNDMFEAMDVDKSGHIDQYDIVHRVKEERLEQVAVGISHHEGNRTLNLPLHAMARGL